MKMLFCLMVMGALVATSWGSFATGRDIQVTPEFLPQLPMTVTVESEVRAEGVGFTITIGEYPAPSRFYLGSIRIRKDGKPVVASPVQAISQKGPRVYSFVVAPEYLSESDFRLFIGAESGGYAEPGGNGYLFNLEVFHGKKTPNRQPTEGKKPYDKPDK